MTKDIFILLGVISFQEEETEIYIGWNTDFSEIRKGLKLDMIEAKTLYENGEVHKDNKAYRLKVITINTNVYEKTI